MRETIFGSPQEPPLDLSRDLIQPPFNPLRPLLLVSGMGLKLSYPIFIRSPMMLPARAVLDGQAWAATAHIPKFRNKQRPEAAPSPLN